MADPNDVNLINFERVNEYCVHQGIPFKNQSFQHLIGQLREQNMTESRCDLTDQQKREYYLISNYKCRNKDCPTKSKELDRRDCEIDHIVAISNGRSPTDRKNLQLLCKPCHYIKTQEEKIQGYYKMSSTESTFNKTCSEIFNSPLCGATAFSEMVNERKNQKQLFTILK
jgi:5-methylcytosine-specific restriction endonuclease McrA